MCKIVEGLIPQVRIGYIRCEERESSCGETEYRIEKSGSRVSVSQREHSRHHCRELG